MLILRKDKYISAAPRCTCLPPHQHCTEVALGGKQVHLGCASMYLSSSSCNFSSSPPRPSPGTTRLRLVVPGLGLGGLEWSLWWPPRTTSAQVHRGQVQVQLGFASLYLDLALVDLSGVGGGLPRATPAEVVQVKSRSNSASPRWTWTLPVRPQPGSVRSSSATVRLTLKFIRSFFSVSNHQEKDGKEEEKLVLSLFSECQMISRRVPTRVAEVVALAETAKYP